MAEMVVGAALSGFLNVVFDRLASPEVANWIRGKKLDPKLLQELKETLDPVRAVLNDAEKKQFTDSDVKIWLDNLKDAVYFADDLLDEVSTKAATQKEEKVSNLFSRLNIFNVNDREMGRVASELEGIVKRLKSILQLKNSLDLKVDIARDNHLSYKNQSTSVEDGFPIYGREEDKAAVMKLVSDDKGDGEVSVIPIVGMGGVGKTTLARLIYNADDLKQVFDFKAWVCISEEFDILKVTRTIAKKITGKHCEMDDLDSLHGYLIAELKEKCFLIVLDDVWIERYDDWTDLVKPFQRGIRGSKILITTRSDKVADVAETDQAYHLNQLSDEDCWLVFANHACLSSESTEKRIALEKTGKEIVRKCKGLPLAAKSLGGMLRRKHDIKDWNNILNSDIWDLSESTIIPALRVSYHYLPPHLKRCFVYCSLLPKDYEFEKKDLILLWIAEDLLSPAKKGKTLEEVGDEYFDDLASRSFFQCSSSGNQVYVMHDLMNDLATSLGGEFCVRLEKLGCETKISEKTRHLSFSKFNDSISENFEVFNRLKFLRTFLPVGFYEGSLANELVAHIFSKNKTLRVLSISCFHKLEVLPDSIVELIHLRYLDLSETQINTLPESLGNLYNLQTLLLRHCDELTMLPDSIQTLVSLRNLDIRSTYLKEMPKGMGKLNQLQGLDYFIVGKHEDNGIKELGNLSNLHGSLEIRRLEHITNSDQAMGARMMDKKHINRLFLKWSLNYDCVDSQIQVDILRKLQPHQDMELLHIKCYNGTRFPDWLGYSSYRNMKDLKLSSCNNCCMLPSLGQLPSLKTLQISRLDGLEKIDASFYKNDDSSSVKPFPSLQSLRFHKMPNWEVWTPFGSDAFPLLERLEIRDCPKLKGGCMLPSLEQLPSLKTLKISRLDGLEKIDASFYKNDDSYSVKPFLSLQSLRFHKMPNWEVWTPFGSDAFPQLEQLEIIGCPKLKGGCMLPSLGQLPSLKTLQISRLYGLETIDASFYKNDDSYSVKPFPSLQSLRFHKMPNWEVWTPFGSDAFPQLEHLEIIDCPKLKGDLPHHLPALKTLRIENCIQIASSLPSAPTASQSENIKSNKLPFQELPHSIESITIKGSPRLVDSMFEILANTQPTCLQYLDLKDSSSEFLSVSIRHEMQLQHLEHAHQIRHSPRVFCNSISLISLPLDAFQNPSYLSIDSCENLESLSVSGSHSLQNLTRIVIAGCPNFVSFPREGLQAPNLTSLLISDCHKLKSLPHQMNVLLPKLESVRIYDCPEIEPFLEGSMPPDIREMKIANCEKLLGGLALPKEGLLPPSLTSLTLFDFSSLETLDCKGLLHLTSLQGLAIFRCPKLENMEGEKLPASLRVLHIEGCPLMQERCRTKHPQIWPKISHIPDIYLI